ncbi:MAG: aspartate--tRNA ligase [Acidimicrobiales bacterium]|nr:aspartate--tRNA ligase [Acidimicrobiales bacterium]MDP6240991.1 aspartate--tRNA ligase [Acidimicrobiales bacterium]MDP7125458.1 aspartate--tRNA ligase [Acidimicrobiales bacterium]MDP7352257.1 aspartate--tRNA ligase [Acidimicrobiales bacterium]MDP7507981.1 aspartate--tRNA ligase [Acidimicrobiales bacterium]
MTDRPTPDYTTSMRSTRCGDLRADDIGSEATLCGWVDSVREHGEHLAFVDLRDRSGVVQVVVDGAHDLRSEFVLQVTGTVRARPDETANEALATGMVEVEAAEVTILARSEPPPFPIDDRTDVDEVLRLRHRYVDLRRSRLQRNLEVRATVNSSIRGAMEEQGFIEVETPMLIASTPEGARDFVVPSRKEPGAFYALPQSPQIFKQLCMVGGVDRYYQIARCLRDEDLRADRQFEFMQLDAEASFVDQDDVLGFITHAVSAAVEAVTGERPGEFPRMTWLEAQERFGSDKPDTRFGLELVELTEVFADTEFRAFRAPCIKGIRVPGGADVSRSRLDDLTDQCRQWGAKGLVWMRVEADGLNSPVAKFLSEDEMAALRTAMAAEDGDLLFLVADERRRTRHVLGLLRLELGRPPVTEGGLNFLWVVDFPLYEGRDEAGNPIPAHHPFTMPHEDDLDLLESGDLLEVRSQAYDLVVNGWELGSGSVRIHRREVQEKIFATLGIGTEEAQEKFGFLLDAFRYGAPPHAGFAFGMDRLVAILAGEDNIREVIAFPKTQSGADPLTGAPTAIDDRHLEELGLRVLPPKQ